MNKTAILLRIAGSIIGIHGIILAISSFRDGISLNNLNLGFFVIIVFGYLIIDQSRRVIPERLKSFGNIFGTAALGFFGLKVILELLALGNIIPQETADAFLTWDQRTDGSTLDLLLRLVGNIITAVLFLLFFIPPLFGWCLGKFDDLMSETSIFKTRLPKIRTSSTSCVADHDIRT